MAHELATVNGRTSMMFTGEQPRHGLGIRLDTPATARETIQAAGLDYDVKLFDMTITTGIPVASRKAVVRTETNDANDFSGLVSDRRGAITAGKLRTVPGDQQAIIG